ncbi:hypothetical protein ABK040_013820 [Willaertia magna]
MKSISKAAYLISLVGILLLVSSLVVSQDDTIDMILPPEFFVRGYTAIRVWDRERVTSTNYPLDWNYYYIDLPKDRKANIYFRSTGYTEVYFKINGFPHKKDYDGKDIYQTAEPAHGVNPYKFMTVKAVNEVNRVYIGFYNPSSSVEVVFMHVEMEKSAFERVEGVVIALILFAVSIFLLLVFLAVFLIAYAVAIRRRKEEGVVLIDNSDQGYGTSEMTKETKINELNERKTHEEISLP